MPIPIAVLISGTGTNLRAILSAIDAGDCDARVCVVASDKKKARGLTLAEERGIPTEVVRLQDFDERAHWDAALAETLAKHEPELVVLAGFMKVVGDAMLDRFPSRIVNVHPSLLPAFPGAHGPELALEAGVRISGCTVHLVDRGVDTGPILAQAAVPVLSGDDVAALHARIQSVEHRLLPAVVDAIARGVIALPSGGAPEGSREPGHAEDGRALFAPRLDDRLS